MNIALVDKQKESLNVMKNRLSELHEYDFDIYTYINTKDMDASLISFDLILLDIEIGIVYSKNNKDKNIVLLSDQGKGMGEYFTSNVYGLIEKKDFNNDFGKTVQLTIQDIVNMKFIHLKVDNIKMYFDLKQIVYLQYIGGRTVGFVYKKHHFIIKTCILKDVRERLGKEFIYIDRNTIININKIKDIMGNKVVMKGIPQFFDISTRRVHTVKEAYMRSI